MSADPLPLQHYLKKVYSDLEMNEAVANVEVVSAYRNIAGDFINKLTTNLYFRDGKLYLKIISPALRQEISYKQQSLIARINSAVGHDIVKQIVFSQV